MEKCIVTQSRLLVKQWSFGFIESSPLTRSMKNYFGFIHASSFPLHEGQLFYWSIMTAVDSIKCRCAHSGMTGQAGGFQNPGVCLQAFPSFLPRPSPLFYFRHFSRGLWLSFLVLCSCTAQKRLLRRLHLLKCSFKSALNTKNSFATVALQTEQKRYYHCKIFMKLWSLLTTREQCNFRCCRQLNHTVHVSYCKRLTQF